MTPTLVALVVVPSVCLAFCLGVVVGIVIWVWVTADD